MRRNTRKNIFMMIAILIVIIIAGVLIFAISNSRGGRKFDAPYTEYECDVKNLQLATTIEIKKEGEDFAKVKGETFTFVTDPLTMYDMEDKKAAYAGDAYHFISQDSHAIYVDNAFSVEMVGLVDFLGESYEIYDFDENKIAKVECNAFNTRGEMYDAKGTLLAEYSSNFFFNDFNVKISGKCELDERTVLMIFCSYYSDQHADNTN